MVDKGGVPGAIVITLFGSGLSIFLLFKKMGWTGFGDKSKMVSSTRLDAIDRRLGGIEGHIQGVEQRLTSVERDLEDRPTRNEMHEIQKTLVRIEERDKGRDERIKAMGAGVSRIEGFLLDLAKGKDR
jgi:hypothetical protein